MSGRGAFRLICAGLAALALAAGRADAAEPVQATLALAREAPPRLVLDHWPTAGWIVRQSGRLVELTLPGAPVAVATDAVALPAGGGAVATLESRTWPGGTVLRLGLGCDCGADRVGHRRSHSWGRDALRASNVRSRPVYVQRRRRFRARRRARSCVSSSRSPRHVWMQRSRLRWSADEGVASA